MKRFWFRFLIGLIGLGSITACAEQDGADKVLFNGKIVTLDRSSSITQAIAIDGDRILSVGTDEDILALADGDTARIDLEGRTVVPGFADNHYHSIGGGAGVDLSRARSLDELIDAIAARARETPAGEVIVTNSDWHEGQLGEQRLPYRDDLDQATVDHPVVVIRGGHELILNSAAIEHWGIDSSFTSPAGGHVGRYPDGRLNGELVDTAKAFVELPKHPAPPDRLEALVEEFRGLSKVGLTSIRYGAATPELYHDLEALNERGDLEIRIAALLRLPRGTAPESLSETLESWAIGPTEGDAWLRVAGVKLGVDGGFEGGWMREPYSEPWGRGGTYYGLQTMPRGPYIAIVRGLNERGWRVGTHAVGDAAIDLVLEAYERANEDESIVDDRWAIEHGFIPRAEHFPRMKALGLHVAAQHHLYLAAPSLIKYWGQERAEWVTPVRAYLDAEIPVSLGTDAPVVPYPPLWVLYHFITRDTISAGAMGEAQKITREEALRAMGPANAELTFEEHEKGTLEAGKLADLVVLSDDILTCEPDRIRDMDVVLTMVGGEIVYER